MNVLHLPVIKSLVFLQQSLHGSRKYPYIPNPRRVIGNSKREIVSKVEYLIIILKEKYMYEFPNDARKGDLNEKHSVGTPHLPLSGYCLLIWIPFISFTAKSQELKKDIEILSQTFERVIDRKEAIIKSLVKDIEEAEEQYQMALRSHLQNVDRLIGIHIYMY